MGPIPDGMKAILGQHDRDSGINALEIANDYHPSSQALHWGIGMRVKASHYRDLAPLNKKENALRGIALL